MIEYLERHTNDSTKKLWRYPGKEDGQITETIQIFPCNGIDAWDIPSTEIIEGLFQSMYM